ncbi:t-SNARE [Lactifluus volemus]|nr:t-SNARE [Lactifluus volemus]
MPVQDRTNEFLACVESIRNRSSLPARNPDKERLLDKQARTDSKSEFTRMASAIGKDISNTSVKLGKLAQLAKRKTLFDDRPVEISELTFVIKQDIANINKEIAMLQAHVKQRKAQGGSKSAEGKQIEEHSHNVVVLLQNRLADTSMTFKDVLEVRTQVYSFLFSNTQRQDSMGKGRATPNDGMLAFDLEHAEGGLGAPNGGSGAFQQMQLVEQQDNYIQSRSTAIESIETTIAELGQIFNQLANMVAEQRETVQRIDADTLDIASNVGGAQRELLKYYASISSNRWLMLKVFGVLIVFFLIFILVS